MPKVPENRSDDQRISKPISGLSSKSPPPAVRSRRGRQAWYRGQMAEIWGLLWLWLKGYRILGRRLKTPVGEIDILARKKDVLAVVEVKARPTEQQALEALRPRQKKRVIRALLWVRQNRPALQSLQPRFDLLLIIPRRWPRHVRDAWQVEDPSIHV